LSPFKTTICTYPVTSLLRVGQDKPGNEKVE